MINKICTTLELSAKEIHALESFNKFNGTNLTLNSDMALIKKLLCIAGLKTGLRGGGGGGGGGGVVSTNK